MIRTILQFYLQPLLGNCVITLCDLLQIIGGVLSGSCILEMYLAGFITPFDEIATILVPESRHATLHNFLSCLEGYHLLNSRNISWRYESLCSGVFNYVYQVCMAVLMCSLICLYRLWTISDSLSMCAKAPMSFLC